MLLVLLIFSVSYTYRLAVDFASISDDEAFESMPQTRPRGYACLVFFMYFIGEMVPLFAIFWFHYKNNKTFEKKYQEIHSCNADNTPRLADNIYQQETTLIPEKSEDFMDCTQQQDNKT